MSVIVTKQLSKYKQYLDPEKFKKMAKKFTSSLVDKERRSKRAKDFNGITDAVKKAAKKWLSEKVKRHVPAAGIEKPAITKQSSSRDVDNKVMNKD